jgi:creatinine amidohydrolase
MIMSNDKREIRFELLRPGQLIEERKRCPLIFIPVAPLEYHGPHLPLGTDPINATFCALETCTRIGKGVVLPAIYFGTERERPPWMVESLGFKSTDWVVGMDFPTALWKSHYYQEHIFALVLASKIEMLINHDYKVIVIVNGHGAVNQLETVDRLSKHYSHASDCLVVWSLSFPDEVTKDSLAGHADLYETSLMMYYQKLYGSDSIVDLTALPEKSVPIHYPDFSIVDGAGFSKNPSPGKIVKTDPRDASEEMGEEIYEDIVKKFIKITQDALKEKGLL